MGTPIEAAHLAERYSATRAAARATACALVALLAAAGPLATAWARAEGPAPAAPQPAQALAPAPATTNAAATVSVLGWPDGVAPRAPQNFRVTVYARGLIRPRSLLVLPNGDVLVSEAPPAGARVTLLRDSNGAGVADQQFVLLGGLKQPYGLALRRDRLYVASGAALLSCPYLVGQTRMHGECRQLLDLPSPGSGEPAANGIALSPDEGRLYVASGARAILAARPDGRELRVYSKVPADPAGLAFEPRSGVLWATLGAGAGAGDGPGEGSVSDCLTSAREGGHGGRGPGAAEFCFEAPGAALGLAFYGREHFPPQYRGGAFVAQHGLRRGAELAGYKVVFVPFAAGRPAGAAQDFLTGFVRDAAQGQVYGRPAGLAVATDGTLLVADDAGGTIWRVTFKCAACTPDPPSRARRLAAR